MYTYREYVILSYLFLTVVIQIYEQKVNFIFSENEQKIFKKGKVG